MGEVDVFDWLWRRQCKQACNPPLISRPILMVVRKTHCTNMNMITLSMRMCASLRWLIRFVVNVFYFRWSNNGFSGTFSPLLHVARFVLCWPILFSHTHTHTHTNTLTSYSLKWNMSVCPSAHPSLRLSSFQRRRRDRRSLISSGNFNFTAFSVSLALIRKSSFGEWKVAEWKSRW